tara:strand:+ start:114 stop:305 length:192 start_codon:yes stop_codon:yes gene_type:complete
MTLEKYLLALKCLLAASALDKGNTTVKEQTSRFKAALDTDSESISPKAKEVIKSEFAALGASS